MVTIDHRYDALVVYESIKIQIYYGQGKNRPRGVKMRRNLVARNMTLATDLWGSISHGKWVKSCYLAGANINSPPHLPHHGNNSHRKHATKTPFLA